MIERASPGTARPLRRHRRLPARRQRADPGLHDVRRHALHARRELPADHVGRRQQPLVRVEQGRDQGDLHRAPQHRRGDVPLGRHARSATPKEQRRHLRLLCAGGDCYLDTVSYNGVVVKLYWEGRTDPVTYAIGGQDTCYHTCYQTCYQTCYDRYGYPYDCNPYSCNPYSCNPYTCGGGRPGHHRVPAQDRRRDGGRQPGARLQARLRRPAGAAPRSLLRASSSSARDATLDGERHDYRRHGAAGADHDLQRATVGLRRRRGRRARRRLRLDDRQRRDRVPGRRQRFADVNGDGARPTSGRCGSATGTTPPAAGPSWTGSGCQRGCGAPARPAPGDEYFATAKASDLGYSDVRPAAADVNGDGKADSSWRSRGDGNTAKLPAHRRGLAVDGDRVRSHQGACRASIPRHGQRAGDARYNDGGLRPRDVNGDGKADIVLALSSATATGAGCHAHATSGCRREPGATYQRWRPDGRLLRHEQRRRPAT